MSFPERPTGVEYVISLLQNGPEELSRLLRTIFRVEIIKSVFPEPLHQDDWRSKLCREVGQDDHIVALSVDLEDTDVVQGLLRVVGLQVGIQPD